MAESNPESVKALDQSRRAAWTEGRDDGDLYYRPHFRLPEFREAFTRVPEPLRAPSHSGDDVVDGSPLADDLAQREWAVTTDDGNLVAFDGESGLHRGGVATGSKRYALQVGFQPRRRGRRTLRSAIKNGERALRRHVRDRLRSLVSGEDRQR